MLLVYLSKSLVMWTHILLLLLRQWRLNFYRFKKEPGMVVKVGQKNFKYSSVARHSLSAISCITFIIKGETCVHLTF